MALYTTKGSSNIPENTIKLNKDEALTYQKELVRDWNKATDVIFLRNGKYFASGIISVSSFIITRYLKQMLKLEKYFTVTTFPIIGFPTLFSYLDFDRKVTNNVLLMEMKCPICWQVRYAFQQTLSGVVFPFTFGISIYSFSAIVKQTTDISDVNSDPKKLLQLMYKFYKIQATKLKILTTVHVLSSFFWPYIQNVELKKIAKCLQEKSNNYDDLIV